MGGTACPAGGVGFDKPAISGVPASVSGRVDTPSGGPFTETFFLPPFQWQQILDSSPSRARRGQGSSAGRARPAKVWRSRGPPRISQVEAAKWRWPRT